MYSSRAAGKQGLKCYYLGCLVLQWERGEGKCEEKVCEGGKGEGER